MSFFLEGGVGTVLQNRAADEGNRRPQKERAANMLMERILPSGGCNFSRSRSLVSAMRSAASQTCTSETTIVARWSFSSASSSKGRIVSSVKYWQGLERDITVYNIAIERAYRTPDRTKRGAQQVMHLFAQTVPFIMLEDYRKLE
jgi:hypothetical protein